MSEGKSKNGFIRQAGILAAAGILCRIIGILYRSPLTAIIGPEGNGYYSTAYNIYTIILLISSYSIPSAMSKIVSQRLALKEYRNANRIFHCALIYVGIIGGIAGLITYLYAEALVGKNSSLVLKMFAPAIVLSGFLGVLRGYFQAHHTMLQTSVSQIIEQIMNAVLSLVAAYYLIQTFSGSDKSSKAVYGAAGSALGTVTGVLFALIFMILIYFLNKKLIDKRIRKDTTDYVESYPEIFKVILLMVTPIILSTFVYNFSTVLNQTIYNEILSHVKGILDLEIKTGYGIYSGEAVIITNIPIAIASAMSGALLPSISGAFIKGEIKQMKQKISDAVRILMIITLPSIVGIMVLSRPIMLLLFPQKASVEIASNLLTALGITILFYSLSTLTNSVLQSIGKVNLLVTNAAAALVVQTIVLVPLLLYTDLDLYCLVIASIVYSFCMYFLNGIFVRKYLGYRQEHRNTFIKPAIASIIMGAAAFGIYKGIYSMAKNNVLALATSIILAALIYFIIILKARLITENEIYQLPKGYVILKLVRKLHL